MNKMLWITGLSFLTCHGIAQELKIPTPQWRPLYHFTPQKNWTNDPNGLIYLDGVYHLYNQQNPFENKWGHMSWGHAISKDLLNWKQLPVAIPETIDKDTSLRFSGCAVYDKNNTSGFCKNGGCLVAIYTADQPNLKKESQFVAYSNDRGLTFTDYVHNPVIDLNMKDFRDPNVFWYAPLQFWLMVVALPTEHKIRFYKSLNLKNWKLLSEFGNQGITTNIWECPFLVHLPVNGNSRNKKWVVAVSCGGYNGGPFIQYFVGDFNGKTFKNDNPAASILTVDYGDSFYAAIPWNNLPNDRQIYIGWLVPGSMETYPWKGQMSIPRDLTLRATRYGIRLFQNPSSIISKSFARANKLVFDKSHRNLKKEEVSLLTGKGFSKNSYWLDAELSVRPGEKAGFKIVQKKDEKGNILNEIAIGFDGKNNILYVDKSRSVNNTMAPDKQKLLTSVALENNKLHLQILVDRSSLEVFANHGQKVISTMIYPPEDATGISAFAKNGDITIDRLKIWDMSLPAK